MRKGQFYVFNVFAVEEVDLPEHFLVIEPGLNTFSAVVEDLDAFTRMLTEAKVTVRKVHTIGEIDPAADGLSTFQLPGTEGT